MTFSFDLISDLHVQDWPQKLQWEDQPTSPYCLLVGDVARERKELVKTLRHLARCYQAVFYIDGNEEHRDHWADLEESYNNLAAQVGTISNLVYLRNDAVIINGVAIIGANGWWSYDLGPCYTYPLVGNHTDLHQQRILSMAIEDSQYLAKSIARLQKHPDVRHIVIATHTVPVKSLIDHDCELSGTDLINHMGNPYLEYALESDLQNKVHTWCFGHYHGTVDRMHRGIRFVNNCRGKDGKRHCQAVFHPRRITIGN